MPPKPKTEELQYHLSESGVSSTTSDLSALFNACGEAGYRHSQTIPIYHTGVLLKLLHIFERPKQ